MEASLYKTLTVSRGFDYHYFYSPAQDGKHTVVFLHGYPSTSYDWHHQAAFFRSRGFGVLVPDMLGYGGTAKPLDVQAYKLSLMSRDIVDLLEAENLHGTIAVGHDWCVAEYHADHFRF
jgi:soluble epoxide hydrolase/lipid-phosphate phosphatase